MASSKKPTWRRVATYLFVLVLLALARPEPPWFWVGFAVSLPGMLLRMWACGYLHKNKVLATGGPYAHLKHPLYVGTFLGFLGFLIGITTPHPPGSYLALAGFPIFFLAYFLYYFPKKNQVEKDRMRKRFGEEFLRWDREVPDFLPRLKPYRPDKPQRFEWSGLVRNSEISMFLVYLAGWTYLFLRLKGVF